MIGPRPSPAIRTVASALCLAGGNGNPTALDSRSPTTPVPRLFAQSYAQLNTAGVDATGWIRSNALGPLVPLDPEGVDT